MNQPTTLIKNASQIPGFEYDIFISYRHNDNRSGWVSDFVDNLRKELAATIKEPVSVYFDVNTTDGLMETHHVDRSLENKLKCLLFIPILSQTYCDQKSFAWRKEFCEFNQRINSDSIGRTVELENGNVANRILPVQIHDLDKRDKAVIENELGEILRSIDFIYKAPGVNRPLTESDVSDRNTNQTYYRDQINKVANAVKEILQAILESSSDLPVNGHGTEVQPLPARRKEDRSMDEKLLEDLKEAVDANLTNEKFSVEDLADVVAMSRSHLHRKLRQLKGQSISQFIRDIRLEHGFQMLKNDVATVSEIAYRIGFGSNTYFIKCFHEKYGYSPGEVKKRLAEKVFPERSTPQEKAVAAPIPVQNEPAPLPLESFHPASSESLIKEVFESMVAHKPALEKFLLTDEGEEDLLDIRLLAYQIFKSYPWPISVELRRLFSASLKDAGIPRYQQLHKAIERIVKFIAFVAHSEITNLLHLKKIQLDETTKQAIVSGFENLSSSSLIVILQAESDHLGKNKDSLYVPELVTALDAAFFRETEEWLSISQSRKIDAAEATELCAQMEQVLIFFLNKSAFLINYKLVNVNSIQVKKPRFKQASFEHRFQILNSSDPEFKNHQETMDNFSDSHAVLLMKSLHDAERFLNLSPLLIDTHGDESTTQLNSTVKKDIYLFENYDGINLQYVGTHFDGIADLSLARNYDDLKASYFEMINLIQQS